MEDERQSAWTTLVGCLLAPLALLYVPLIPLLVWFGWNKLNAKPDYVIGYLEKFIARSEGALDWDQFCSVPLTDPRLDAIRKRACRLWKPQGLTGADMWELQTLLAEARQLGGKRG